MTGDEQTIKLRSSPFLDFCAKDAQAMVNRLKLFRRSTHSLGSHKPVFLPFYICLGSNFTAGERRSTCSSKYECMRKCKKETSISSVILSIF